MTEILQTDNLDNLPSDPWRVCESEAQLASGGSGLSCDDRHTFPEFKLATDYEEEPQTIPLRSALYVQSDCIVFNTSPQTLLICQDLDRDRKRFNDPDCHGVYCLSKSVTSLQFSNQWLCLLVRRDLCQEMMVTVPAFLHFY